MGCGTAPIDESAIAYVRFASSHPAHYAVMHRPEPLAVGDAELVRASEEAFRALTDSPPASGPAVRETHASSGPGR